MHAHVLVLDVLVHAQEVEDNTTNDWISMLQKYKSLIPKPGIYHFERMENGGRSHIHLRIDPDQKGILLVNASKVFHLNQTASSMAYLLLQNKSFEDTLKIMRTIYHVKKSAAKKDLDAFSKYLFEIIDPNGACPIHELDLEILPPFKATLTAPYRMDIALTYRCNNDCAHCYNERSRDFPELSTNLWFKIIDKIWEVGIPHIVFTGGEPTLRDDLTHLIAYAQAKGIITGINTNGRKLSNSTYLETLIQSGLDHIQITFESHDPDIHDEIVGNKGAYNQTLQGLKNCLSKPIFLMTNTTLLKQNSPYLEQTLEILTSYNVPTIGLNGLIHSGRGAEVNTGFSPQDLVSLLEKAREITSKNNQRLIWYTPTQYCHFDPMQLSLGVKGCTASLYNMCIEPDGGVIPCQSYYFQIGNILKESWSEIWNHELAIYLRDRNYLPKKCMECLIHSVCGGGCPLEIKENSMLPERLFDSNLNYDKSI